MEPGARRPGEASDEGAGRSEAGGGARGEGAAARGRFEFERAWVVAACLLLFAAATLLYLGRAEAAFVTAALGVSAWFLDIRKRIIRKHDLVKRGGRNWEPRGRGED